MFFRNILTKIINDEAFIIHAGVKYKLNTQYLPNWIQENFSSISDSQFFSVLKENNLIREFGPSCKIINKNLLSTLHIELTDNCMCKCPHCYVGEHKSTSLSLIDFIQIIDEFILNGATSINYSGGEPTLNPEFSQIIKYGKTQGLYQTLFTNGCIKDDLFISIYDNIDAIQVSIDGDENYHNKFRGKLNLYATVIDSLSKFAQMNKPIIIAMAVTMENVNLIPHVYNLAKKFNATFRMSPPAPIGRFNHDTNYYKELLSSIMQICKLYNILLPELCPSHSICNAINKKIYIDVHQNLYPCPLLTKNQFLIAHYEQGKLEATLTSQKIKDIRSAIKKTYLEKKCLYYCPAFIFGTSAQDNTNEFWGACE